ncbi:MAG: type II toxin-antitoxin system HicB family antitoxin [Dehalococcoidia bacterium]
MKNFQVIRSSVVFELQTEPEGGYTIATPSSQGCISYGKTLEEAIEMIKDAMDGMVVATEEGVPIPEQFKAIQAMTI